MSEPITHWLHWKSRVDPLTWRCTIDWSAEFGNDRPIEVEIGCGNGMWLRAYGALYPRRNLIGVELVSKFVRETNRRTVRDAQNNVRHLAGDMRVILPLAFSDCSVGRAFVNFPDPWFKKKHKKRRLLNRAFLKMLSRKLIPGANVVVATDDAEYCAYTYESFAGVEEFSPLFDGPFTTELAEYPQTKYERKWRAMGRTIYYLSFVNTRNAAIDDRAYMHEQQLEFALELLGIDISPSERGEESENADGMEHAGQEDAL